MASGSQHSGKAAAPTDASASTDISSTFKQIGGMCRLMANKRVTMQLLHAVKKKSKGYGKALHETTQSLMKNLEDTSEKLCIAGASRKPGMNELVQGAAELLMDSPRHIGLMSKVPEAGGTSA